MLNIYILVNIKKSNIDIRFHIRQSLSYLKECNLDITILQDAVSWSLSGMKSSKTKIIFL